MPGELYTLSTQVGQIFHILGGSPKPEAVHRAMLQIAPLKNVSQIKTDLERVERNLTVPHDPEAIWRARKILLGIEGRLVGEATRPEQASLPQEAQDHIFSLLRNEGEITDEDVQRAHRWIREPFVSDYLKSSGENPVLGARHVEWSPLKEAPVFSAATGLKVYTKNERFQSIRCFKNRGAGFLLSHEKIREKITGKSRELGGNSHGNAAQGLVRQSKNWRLNKKQVLLNLPTKVSAIKHMQCLEMGARVELFGKIFEDGEANMRRWEKEDPENRLFVPAYNHRLVVVGQGSLGKETFEDLLALGHEKFAAIVPFGGGGLVAGLGLALEGERRNIQVIGVNTAKVPFGHDSFKSGEIVCPDRQDIKTVCEGTLLLDTGSAGFPYIRRHVSDVVLIPEELVQAGIAMYHDFGEIIEGSGALPAAALVFGFVQTLDLPSDLPIVLIESGGNIDDEVLEECVQTYGGGRWMELMPPENRERLAKFLSN